MNTSSRINRLDKAFAMLLMHFPPSMQKFLLQTLQVVADPLQQFESPTIQVSADVPLNAAVNIVLELEQFLQELDEVQELQSAIGQLLVVVATQVTALPLRTIEQADIQAEQVNR